MRVGIVGCTGAVGKELINLLDEQKFPVDELRLFASERSSGKEISTPFGNKTIESFSLEEARKTDVLFLAVSGEFAKQYARELAKGPDGPIVIDNSSALRLEKDIPLVVPEINGYELKNARLIANPNCTTAIAVMALWPIHVRFGLKKVIVSSYQAASGAGAEGMIELIEQARQVVSGIKPNEYNDGALDLASLKGQVFAYPLAFNIIPHIDTFQSNGYTREEMKVAWETCKIFNDESIKISCTAVRIPTMRAHSEAITIETVLPITPEQARSEISKAAGAEIIDDPSNKKYPMPLTATRKYDVEVGRIRQSLVFGDNGLDFFVSGDQLYRGAALNAIYIAKMAMSGELVQEKKFDYRSRATAEIIVKQAINTHRHLFFVSALTFAAGFLLHGLANSIRR